MTKRDLVRWVFEECFEEQVYKEPGKEEVSLDLSWSRPDK